MSASRVGVITYDWYPFDPRVRRLAMAAASGGYKVDVVCLRQPGEGPRDESEGVQIYRMPMDRGFGRSLPMTILYWCWFMLLSGLTITRLHLRHSYDVIHVHNMPDFLVFAALIPRLLGAKIILDVQDVSPELMAAKASGRLLPIVKRLAIWQERISVAFVQHVVTVGRPFEDLLLQRGVPREKLSVILNSTDPELFPASYRPLPPAEIDGQPRPFIVMYHGTLAERNGLDIAIRALAQAREVVPNIRLDIKGRGEHVPFLKSLAHELKIEDQVVFSDPCALEDLVKFIAHGDVGIIPYRRDGFMDLVLPTKAYEFAWLHRPIIASETPAICSMFRSESLELCDPAKPEEFARAIIDLAQHPEKRARLVADATEDYKPYQWEKMALLYQQLLATLSKKQVRKEEVYPVASN